MIIEQLNLDTFHRNEWIVVENMLLGQFKDTIVRRYEIEIHEDVNYWLYITFMQNSLYKTRSVLARFIIVCAFDE